MTSCFGYFWLFLVIFGYFWLFLVIFGNICMDNLYDDTGFVHRFQQFLWDERIVYREGFKWTFFGKILWWPYEYVTGTQARIDREREDAIQKEIDDIAAEKAAKEARL